LNPATGVPDFVTFAEPGLLLQEAATGSATTVALAFFATYPTLFGTGDPPRQLQVRDVIVGSDPRPMTTVVLQQMIGTVPVWGCELRVHLSSTLAIRSISGNYMRDPEVPFDAVVPVETARNTALVSWRAANELWNIPLQIQDGGLVVLPTALARDGGGVSHLAWWFRFPDAHRFVSASTGEIVYEPSLLHSARRVFDGEGIRNAVGQGPLQVENGRVLVPTSTLDAEALDTDNAIATVEAFWRLLGRDGWNGGGGNSDAFVDVSFDNPATSGVVEENAMWAPFFNRATFSRGWAVPDVIGHEFTHGVTSATANLIYQAESGALNESFSDVFGELIFPDPNPTTWLVGNRIASPTTATPLRNMANPTVRQYSQFSIATSDSGGVHTNSGIGNRAAVLLSDGDGTPAHPGIGRSRLARLYWEVLTKRLHPWSTYIDQLHNTWEAARNLVGDGRSGVIFPGSPGPAPRFEAANIDEVLWAFQQGQLNVSLSSGWYQVPGNRTTNFVFFAGTQVPSGQTVSDAEVRVMRRIRDPLGGLINSSVGIARVSTGGIVSDPTGRITGAITSHGVGTRNREIQATVTTTDYSPVDVSANVYTTGVAQPQQVLPTPGVAHWFDNPFFLGRRYGDIIYEGANLASGCTVDDILLELFDGDGNIVASHRFDEPPATWGRTGAWIWSRNLGGTNLEVRVRSWHDFGWAVRYRLVYTISGTGCTLPAFTLREVGPDNL